MSEENKPEEPQHWLAGYVGKIVIIQLATPYIAGRDKEERIVATDLLEGKLAIGRDDGGRRRFVLLIQSSEGDSYISIPDDAVLYMTVLVPRSIIAP